MIKKLLPILGITFIDIIGFSMLLPILPLFVTHFGVTAFVVGLMFSTFSLCQLIAGPIWGNLSDRIGRKAVLIISQVGATIGWGMLAFAPSIAWVFVARIIEGTSGGNIGITQAYVADLVSPKERSRAFGLIGATFGAGMVFGPASGALLMKYGYAAPFLTAAALQLLTLILTIVLLPESRSHVEGEEHVGFRDILKTFGNIRVSRILWQKLAVSLGLYGWFTVIALYLQAQLGLNQWQIGFTYSAFALLNVAVNGFGVGKVSSKLGERAMSNIGLASLVTAFALVPFTHTIAVYAVVMALFAFGMALANSGITALISNAASDREQGTVLSVGSSLDAFSGIVAPPVSTGLFTRNGPSSAGLEPLLFTAAALLMGFFLGRKDHAYNYHERHAEVLDQQVDALEMAET